MRIFIRACWAITVIAFIYNLFNIYVSLQPVVSIRLGEFAFFAQRGQFFFLFLGFFAVLNIAVLALASVVPQIHKSLFFVPAASFWTANKTNRAAANRILVNWLWATGATANYFLIYWMLVVENAHHFEGNAIPSVQWFHLPGLVMAASLLSPIFRLAIKNIDLLDRNERA